MFLSFILMMGLMLAPWWSAEASAATLFEQFTHRVHIGSAFTSGNIDASKHTDLVFSFFYDSTLLDGGATPDTFSYGFTVGGESHILETIIGLAGSQPEEIGNVSVLLPESAEVEDLVLFVTVSANSAMGSDRVDISEVKLTGTLVEVEEEPVIDVCANLDGAQAEVPVGYLVDEEGNCYQPEELIDVCPNLDGLQIIVPAGYEVVGESCQPVEDPVIDLCPNIEGNQVEIPVGYEYDESNNCVPEEVEVPTPESEEVEQPTPQPENPDLTCPRGFSRWVDKVSGSNIWRADDVYREVILVGRLDNNRRNFSIERHVYIPGPTEIGDRYQHRFQDISHVCVR